MDYETILKNDLYAAMRANDTLRKRVIRLLISSIELAEVAKGSKLTDSEFIALVQKEISEAELVQLAEEVIQETGATSPKDMGKVLKVLIPKLAGRATNQDASRVVKDCLTKLS